VKRLEALLSTRTGPSIVYVTLQSQAESVTNELRKKGIDADFYHAGMKAEEREKIQNKFMASKDSVVVATIAFGMGIDKGVT
jgi:superfamily II DNA helicase RecQ